eukprot:gene3010-5893_t
MEALDTFLSNVIDNSEVEFKLFSNYAKLISISDRDINALDRHKRDFAHIAEVHKEEIKECDGIIEELDKDYRNRDIEWVNAQTEKVTRESQIQRLLDMPVMEGDDVTYIYPRQTGDGRIFDKRRPTSAGTAASTRRRRIRSGEITVLEATLAQLTQDIDTKLKTLFQKSDQLHGSHRNAQSSIMQQVTASQDQAVAVVNQIEDSQLKSFNTVREILRLRLVMIRMQREELEQKAFVAAEIEAFEEQERSMRKRLVGHVDEITRALQREMVSRKGQYEEKLASLKSHKMRLEADIERERNMNEMQDVEHSEANSALAAAKKRKRLQKLNKQFCR